MAHPRAFMLKTIKQLALNQIGRSEQRLVDSPADMPDPNQLQSDHDVDVLDNSREELLAFCRTTNESVMTNQGNVARRITPAQSSGRATVPTVLCDRRQRARQRCAGSVRANE